MLEIDKFMAATTESLEGLSWYEIVSKLGLLSFNSQGNKPIELIAELAHITDSSMVLIAGCGAGGTAVHLAETTGATVHGFDMSPESIRAANALASRSPAREKMHFQIGDAHTSSIRPDTFDVVITEYTAFLLQQSAFENFFSVLKPGGQIALAELMKDPEVDAGADARILEAEKRYSAMLGYDFHVPLVKDYVDRLMRAGFHDVRIAERFSEPSLHEKIRNVGGWGNLLRITGVVLRLMATSAELRRKFVEVGNVKMVLVQDRSTAQYIYQAILVGQKPRRPD